MKVELAAKTAIVTGGSKGYGMGIAAALAGKGVDVWITGRDETTLRATADRLGVHACQADATSGADWDRVMQTVLDTAGHLDILVNNAGSGGRIAHLADFTDDDIAEVLSTNLISAALGCRRAAAIMRAQRSGTIVNVSSVCQRQAWPGWSMYSAAKAGLAQLSNCLYTELRPAGVRVTTLIPSWGATQFLDAANLPLAVRGRRRALHPAGRVGRPRRHDL